MPHSSSKQFRDGTGVIKHVPLAQPRERTASESCKNATPKLSDAPNHREAPPHRHQYRKAFTLPRGFKGKQQSMTSASFTRDSFDVNEMIAGLQLLEQTEKEELYHMIFSADPLRSSQGHYVALGTDEIPDPEATSALYTSLVTTTSPSEKTPSLMRMQSDQCLDDSGEQDTFRRLAAAHATC